MTKEENNGRIDYITNFVRSSRSKELDNAITAYKHSNNINQLVERIKTIDKKYQKVLKCLEELKKEV